MMSLKYYNCFIRENIAEIFVFDNDNDRSEIMSRIDYVERNEPRIDHFYIYFRKLLVFILDLCPCDEINLID